MQLENPTVFPAGQTIAVQPDGRELLIVVVKGTFTFPANGDLPQVADQQVPLVETDVFAGEPGVSAPLYENDFAPTKAHCDVLLNGTAYAPRGRSVDRVTVSLRVDSWRKSFEVVGDREWTEGVLSLRSTPPMLFTAMPISYNNAFGGIDKGKDESEPDNYFLNNHAGVGYHVKKSPKSLEGKPLPNTEGHGIEITSPDGDYKPMAFGPLGRAWQQRIKYAGTYDQQWLDNVSPFLPKDFRNEYYQAAPADQWIKYPKGGERVELVNLTPRGSISFNLPAMNTLFKFSPSSGKRFVVRGTTDTLFFEPDLEQFTMTQRYTLPLKRNIHEMQWVLLSTETQ